MERARSESWTYWRVFVGEAISNAGDWFTYVAMSMLAVSAPSAASARALASVVLSHTLARALLAPWAGALCDRVGAARVLWIVPLLRGVLVLLMALSAMRGALWLVHVLHWFRMALGAFSDASLRAVLPSLVPTERLEAAYERSGWAWSVLFVLGIVGGGVVVSRVGVSLAFLLDASSYLLSGLCFWQRTAVAPKVVRKEESEAFWDAFRLWWTFVFAKSPVAMVQGAVWVLLTWRAPRWASDGAMVLSLLHVARGVGMGVGPRVLLQSSTSMQLRPVYAGWIAWMGALAFVWSTSVWIALLALFVTGLGVGANWVQSSSALGAVVAPSLRGRAVGWELAFYTTAQCIGALTVCAALHWWSAPQWGAMLALLLAGMCLLLLSVRVIPVSTELLGE